MSTPDPKHPLDYATPRRERRKLPVRFGYLAAALVCFALAYAGWATAQRTGYIMMPMPDPPPHSDPFWVRRAEDERWFAIGCCSTPVFALSGLVLLVVSFVSRGTRGGHPPAG